MTNEQDDSLLNDMKAVAEAPRGRLRDLAAAELYERLAARDDKYRATMLKLAQRYYQNAAEMRRVAQMYRDGLFAESDASTEAVQSVAAGGGRGA